MTSTTSNLLERFLLKHQYWSIAFLSNKIVVHVNYLEYSRSKKDYQFFVHQNSNAYLKTHLGDFISFSLLVFGNIPTKIFENPYSVLATRAKDRGRDRYLCGRGSWGGNWGQVTAKLESLRTHTIY
jgi:hypothetical protein